MDQESAFVVCVQHNQKRPLKMTNAKMFLQTTYFDGMPETKPGKVTSILYEYFEKMKAYKDINESLDEVVVKNSK